MLGTHRLVISPARCGKSEPGAVFGSDHSAGLYCGNNIRSIEVSLTDNNLVVNAEPYGALEPGDEIAIVYGEVRVNGTRRMPGR
jgi:hypothetical protein